MSTQFVKNIFKMKTFMKRTAIKKKDTRPCKCGCKRIVKVYNTVRDQYFSPACKIKDKGFPEAKPQKKIPQFSKKRKADNAEYSKKRIEFLALPENKFCFIDGCSNLADTIEHRAGRIGSNFLDVSTWAPCCLKHNLELENNPELSKKYQFSKITGKPKL